jgi:hypothetical protein
MFEYFVIYPEVSVCVLAVWSYALFVYLLVSTGNYSAKDDNDMDSFGADIVATALIWVFLAGISYSLNRFFFSSLTFQEVSCPVVLYVNTLATLWFIAEFFWKKFDGAKRYAEYSEKRDAHRKTEEVVETAENICGKMQLPTTAKAELGKALKEWKTVNKEIVPVKKLLAQHQEALAKVRKLQDEAWVHQSSVSDKDLKESYANTAKGLSDQCDELQKLVDEYKRQVDEKNTRIGELMKLFKKAKKDAESYKEYDKFATEALEVQKELKATLLKAKKK